MTAVPYGARRTQVDQRRGTRAGRGRLHDGPEPWSRRAGVVLLVVLALALAGLTVGWAGAGGEAKLDDQRGWLALAIGSLILGGVAMVGWLLIGLRTIAALRAPVVAEVRRRKSMTIAAPAVVEGARDLPAGFGVAPGMRRYHRADCLLLSGKSVTFAEAIEHTAAGLRPCGVCLPEGTPAVHDYVPYLVFGIVYGSIYGLAAMGLVLTYRTSGIFNFGHGAIGAGAAYVFYELRDENGVPWPFAALLAVGVFGALLGLLLEGMARRLSRVPVAYQIVGTIGLLLLIRALVTWIYGSEFRLFGAFLPRGRAFTISGVAVAQDSVIIFATVSVAAVGLYVLVERSRLGTMMRAVVDDPALLDTAGVAPARVRRQAWVIGACFAAASGVLLASQQQELDVTLLSLLVVQAFGAAALGAFRSLPLAYAGGIAVGIAQKLVSKETSTHEWLQGLDFNVPFIVLFFALLLLGRRRLGDLGAQIRARTAPPLPMPPTLRLGGGLAALVGALLVPHIVGSRLPVWISALSQVLLFLSLGLLVHTSGQVSLCHVALAAVGAAAFAHAESGGLPWGLAVLWGGVVAIPVGALVAIPAIRLSGLFLGLATLGFGIFIAQFFYTKSYMFGLSDLKTHRPSAFESDTSYYYLLLAFAIVGIALILTIQRSRLGRLLRSLGDSPTALATLGASANITRVLVFCISAFIAGIGGALYAGEFGSVGGTGFNFVGSLVLLAVLAASGRSTITGAIVGPVLVYVLPAYHSGADDGFQIAFGAGAILAAVFATTKVHLPLHDWAQAGRWRRESTTAARITARTVPIVAKGEPSPLGANR